MKNNPNYNRHSGMPYSFVFIGRGNQIKNAVIGEYYYFSNYENNVSGPHKWDGHTLANWCDVYFSVHSQTFKNNLPEDLESAYIDLHKKHLELRRIIDLAFF